MSKIPSSWQVRRLSGSLGAEISGPDIGHASESDVDAIRELLLEHKVIFMPRQSLSVEQHIAFGRHFGELEGHPNLSNFSDLPPEVFELKATKGGIADEWHTDVTFREHPALMSILHMVTCPEYGGDTLWTNLEAAYDALSEPLQDLCEGLSALHDAHPHGHPEQTAVHPVVRVHPETGRKALYVSEHFTRRIVEMSVTESDVLLGLLTRWVTQPRFTVRYRWTPGTIGIWDNCCTQHFVLDDFDGERIIQRVTVMGDTVQASRESPWQPWLLSKGRLSATSRHDRQLAIHYKLIEAPD
jgi:taurine dioxygenase